MKHSLIALSRGGKILCVELGNPTVSAHQHISTCVCLFRVHQSVCDVNLFDGKFYLSYLGKQHELKFIVHSYVETVLKMKHDTLILITIISHVFEFMAWGEQMALK